MDPTEQPESKSARKREDRRLREMGVRLADLPDEQLEALPLDEALRDAIHHYRRIQSFEARRRQTHFIGRLMRRADATAIESALAALDRKRADTRYAHHALERWRERLLAESAAMTEFVAAHPATDVRRLRALIRRAQADPQDPTHSRALFRFLREVTTDSSLPQSDDPP
jgi:ribosome-associated protein